MTDTPEPGDPETSPHTVQYVDEQPVVLCEMDGAWYGQGGDRAPLYCPYCGGSARGEGHKLEPGTRTVECTFTPEADIQNCPGCGEPIER